MKHRLFVFVFALIAAAFAQAEIRFNFPIKSNCSVSSEIFISQNKKLLFQIPGVQGLGSSVQLNKGQYNVVVLSPDCEFKTNLEIDDVSTVKEVAVNLQRQSKPRMPSSARCTDCVGGDYYSRGFLPDINYNLPYWYPYMQQNYLNYQWPCMWNSFGCNTNFYPVRQHQIYPNGPIVMGKPNIYVQGPDAEKLRLVFLEKSEDRFMASTPSLSENFWEIDLKKNAIFKNSVQ